MQVSLARNTRRWRRPSIVTSAWFISSRSNSSASTTRSAAVNSWCTSPSKRSKSCSAGTHSARRRRFGLNSLRTWSRWSLYRCTGEVPASLRVPHRHRRASSGSWATPVPSNRSIRDSHPLPLATSATSCGSPRGAAAGGLVGVGQFAGVGLRTGRTGRRRWHRTVERRFRRRPAVGTLPPANSGAA